MKFTISTGATYKLEFDGNYYFSTQGILPKTLQGKFTRQVDAQNAIIFHEASLVPVQSAATGNEDLKDLSAKKDLLKWAEENDKEVPEEYKSPLSIKKFLLGGYE